MKTATAPLPPLRSVKVLDQLRERIRYLHYSLPTEQAYVHSGSCLHPFPRCATRQPWAAAKSRHCPGWRTSARFRSPRIVRHWRPCCSSTARCCARICPGFRRSGRPRPSRRLPVVLTPDEVVRILGFLEGEHRLFAQLRYGTGMRISEGLQLRSRIWISDHGTIIVREGKGSKDRALMLPESLAPSLREQLSRARAWWLKDQAEGRSGVALPTPLSGSIRAPGIPGRGSGFCAAHAFDRSTERCRASPSHV